MKFKSVALLIGIFGLALLLVAFLQTNLPVLEQQITLFSFSFSILKCWVASLLVIAALPSVYFGYKYFLLRRKIRISELARQRQRADEEAIAQIEKNIQHQNLSLAENALKKQKLAEHHRHTDLTGKLLLARGQIKEAITTLKEAFSEHHHVDTGYLLAQTMLKNRQSQDAADVLRDMIRNDENAILARKLLIDIYQSQHNWDACLEILDFFRDREKTFFQTKYATFRYAQLQEALQDPTASKKVADQVDVFLKKNPTFVPGYLLLADWYLTQGDEKRAIGVYERGFQASRHSVFLKCLEEYYLKQNRPEDAIQVYRKIRITDDSAVVQYQLGKLFQKLEMTRESLEILEPLRKSFPQIVSLAVDVADLKNRWNRGEEALSELREMVDQHPDLTFPFICRSCQSRHEVWRDRCESCGAWNEIVLEVNWQSEFVTEANPVYY